MNTGNEALITTIHPDIIQSHILNKLDGPTLASTGCATTELFSLCADDHLWIDICNSTWPSTTDPRVQKAISTFPSGHRKLYSDAFPSIRQQVINNSKLNQVISQQQQGITSELISAVDIYFDDKLIFSKVLETETISPWFQNSPFQVELLGEKETIQTPLKFDAEEGTCISLAEERLRVSWILIDTVNKRAVNVASVKAVEARRHWLTEDVQLRFASVVGGGDGEFVQCGVVLTCGGKEGGELHVRGVSMQLEDLEGTMLSGEESLIVLNEAMVGQRRKSDSKLDKSIYQMFMVKKVENREVKQRRERNVDLVFIATGVSMFLAIWMFFLAK